MARTKASVGSKVSVGKSSKARCSVAPAPSSSGSSGSDRASRAATGGGNPVCQRETPKWQRPITNFFINKEGDSKENVDVDSDQEAGSSKPKSTKKNIIESDEEDILTDRPKNSVLDESIELEPLNADDKTSHKIEEYYSKGNKGKGVGKKTKGKENRRESKREREDEEESVSKKVKVN